MSKLTHSTDEGMAEVDRQAASRIGEKPNCETNGHIFGSRAVCVFCGTAKPTQGASADAETLVNKLLNEVTGGSWLATPKYYELHGAVLSAMRGTTVPEGWKLVPVEPTDVMLVEGAARVRDFYEKTGPYPRTKSMYAAMIAAAPETPR